MNKILCVVLCFVTVMFWTQILSEGPARLFVVWDVGQGAWSTLIEPHACYHLDMGGTKFLFGATIKKLCGSKPNILFITHFDQDHISFVSKARFYLPNLCRVTEIAASVTAHKRRKLEEVPECGKLSHSPIEQIFSAKFIDRNDCNMYIAAHRILITGDAPAKLEKQILGTKALPSITYFLLGHHGSRTSSSPALLDQMPLLRAGIASAEKKKYGHPHQETIDRLKARGIPLLITEHDGSIFIHLDAERTPPLDRRPDGRPDIDLKHLRTAISL